MTTSDTSDTSGAAVATEEATTEARARRDSSHAFHWKPATTTTTTLDEEGGFGGENEVADADMSTNTQALALALAPAPEPETTAMAGAESNETSPTKSVVTFETLPSSVGLMDTFHVKRDGVSLEWLLSFAVREGEEVAHGLEEPRRLEPTFDIGSVEDSLCEQSELFGRL